VNPSLIVAFSVCLVAVASCVGGSDRATEIDPLADTPGVPTVEQTRRTPPPVPVADEDISGYAFRPVETTAGGWVTGLVMHPTDPDVRYARTDVGGAFRWNPDVRRWEQMISTDSVGPDGRNAGFYNIESISVSAQDSDLVVMSVGDDQPVEVDPTETGVVLRSDDGGRSWATSTDRFHISGNGGYRQQGERLVIDPLDVDHVVLGTRRDGLQVSVDGGDTFVAVDPAMVPVTSADPLDVDFAGVSFVAADPSGGATSTGETATWYAGVAGAGVYRSLDGAVSWELIRPVEVSVVPQEGQVVDGRLVVAFNDPGGVTASVEHYSASDGWDPIDTPVESTIFSIAVDPADPDRIILVNEAVRTGTTFVSDDGGDSWDSPDVSTDSGDAGWIGISNQADYMPVGRLVFDPHDPGRIWFAEGIGVWTAAFDDNDLEWNFAGRGIEELVVSELTSRPDRPLISTVADFQGFVHDDLTTTPVMPLVDEEFASGTGLDYVASDPDQLVWIGAQSNIYFSPDRVARAARSSDGGLTWDELPNLVPDMIGGDVAVSANDRDNIVWAPSYFLSPFEFIDQPKGIFVTDDGGEQWTRLADVGGTNRFHRFFWWFGRQALVADRVLESTFYIFDDEERFFVSTNGGFEWNEAEHAPPCRDDNDCHVFGQIHADALRPGVVWAATGTDGLHRSDDAGATRWQKVEAVDEVRTLGMGAPIAPRTTPTLFLYGRANGDDEIGLYRSTDDGATFELIAEHPGGSFDSVTVVEGDASIPGRVYIGFAGSGSAVGDDLALASTDQS